MSRRAKERAGGCESRSGYISIYILDGPLQLRLQTVCNSKLFPFTFHVYLLWELRWSFVDWKFLLVFPLQLRSQTFCQRKVSTLDFYVESSRCSYSCKSFTRGKYSISILQSVVGVSHLLARLARLYASDQISDSPETWSFFQFFSARSHIFQPKTFPRIIHVIRPVTRRSVWTILTRVGLHAGLGPTSSHGN